jgi:hypothetical protein
VTFASIGSTIISCRQTRAPRHFSLQTGKVRTVGARRIQQSGVGLRAWPGRDRQQAGGCPVCLRAKPQLSFPKVRWVRPEVLVDEIKKSNHRRLPGPAPHRKKLCVHEFIYQNPLDWSLKTEFLNDRSTHAAADRSLLAVYYRPQRPWRPRRKISLEAFFRTDAIDGHSFSQPSRLEPPLVFDPPLSATEPRSPIHHLRLALHHQGGSH